LFLVATGSLVYKKKLEISAFNGHNIISNFDSNQSDATLVPISLKSKVLSKVQHRSKCKSYSSNCSKAGIIRTEAALRVLFLRALVIINGITSKSIS
jgi:lipoprotein-releasing system permease protein